MLHSELLRIINGRQAWAFVGSGPSIEAGCPSWEALRIAICDAMSPDEQQELDNNRFYGDSLNKKDLPTAFGAIEEIVRRSRLELEAAAAVNHGGTPGQLHRMLADLPFAGYITTNYDHLLEKALNDLEPGWSSVGNMGREVLKASGTADRIVWHVHGSSEMDSSRSRMVLTQEDYDSIYLDGSDVHTQLRGIMAHRRVLIVGFGFRDVDVLQVLKRVGKLTDPDRPIVAMVEREGDFRHQNGRDVFLRQYKVDVQPYRNQDGTHRNLRSTLGVYCSMSVRRSLKFGKNMSAPPTHDPETTGLLIYNDFVLAARGPTVPVDMKLAIVRSRVLAECQSGSKTKAALLDDLSGILSALHQRVPDPTTNEQTLNALDQVLVSLTDAGLLVADGETLQLTDLGRADVQKHAARSELTRDQFRVSIRTRVGAMTSPDRVDNVSLVIINFFDQAIRRRALGVALAFATGGLPSQQEYHTLALLQDVRDWLDSADDEASALVVVDTIQAVLRSPTEAERQHIALGVQARFVLHLLSLDTDSLRIRRDELQNSLFFIDASTIIPWLAATSVGYAGAKSTIGRLHDFGSETATTSDLIEEVAEHIRWAQEKVTSAGGLQTTHVLAAATGRAGNKTNAFLEGFIRQNETADAAGSFNSYVAECLGLGTVREPITNAEVHEAVQRKGLAIVDIARLGDARDRLSASSGGFAAQIKSERQANGSYRHDRQVRAEAHVVAMVAHARAYGLEINHHEVTNAHFISYTSLLNRVSSGPLPVTMRPEAVLSWLATVMPAAEEDVQAITSELLCELQERRMDLVDPALLSAVFGPLVSASRERLEELLPRYQALMTERYGPGHDVYVENIPALDLPVVLESVLYEQVTNLHAELDDRDRELIAARSAAEIALDDRAELERFRKRNRRRNKHEKRMERQRQKGNKDR